MASIGFEHWQAWQREGCTLLPFALTLPNESLPENLPSSEAAPFVLLESAQAGRFSYLCDRPHRLIVGDAEGAEIRSGDGVEWRERRRGAPLEILQTLLSACRVPATPQLPTMAGGLIGAFGYDLVRTWERLPEMARRDSSVPLYALIEARELFVFDHRDRVLHVVVWRDVVTAHRLADEFARAEAHARHALARWTTARAMNPASSRSLQPPAAAENRASLPPSMTAAEFESAARRVHDYIAAGHTYQVNLSRRTSRAVALPPLRIYEALRRVNPSPYMGLLQLPEFSLVCGSPELLVKLENGIVSSRPIAGTRPRGHAAGASDAHFSAELLASEKERAEHLMLVDLIRNDIGRVAEYGSVHVPEFMVLEHYSHVMHIVSQVEGRLAAGRTWRDVFQAMFPGGTITGCPKIRTMEIIEELEPVGRGFYTGSLGWISYAGEMELNIVIRSMLVQAGVAHVQAGAGVVADSQPARELDESERKAQALWVALAAAEAAYRA